MKLVNNVAKVDISKCVGCRKCEERCVAEAIRVGEPECSKGTDEDIYSSPCKNACPAGVNAPAYLAMIEAGRFKDAYNIIRKENPFPAVCGRICTHPCETDCTRNEYGGPVAVADLKRFAADYVYENEEICADENLPDNGKSIGIIGSGPSGLTCGYYLARLGYSVDVYESQPLAGGVLAYGIPDFRLPREVLNREIELIERAGVKTHLGVEVGKDITFEDAKAKHDAVYVSTGTQFSRKINIPGEDLDGVYHGLDFLRDVHLNGLKTVGKKTLVIGGGSTAIDAARVAKRLGAEEVIIVYRRKIADMPADPREIDEAFHENIRLVESTAPVKILGTHKVQGIECVRMEPGEVDESGRRSPVKMEGSQFVIEADMIIPAISQFSDLPFIPKEELETTSLGKFVIDMETRMTAIDGVFAGGDIIQGSTVAIEAIGDGKEAAKAMDKYLGGAGVLHTFEKVDIPERNKWGIDRAKRKEIGFADAEERIKSFDEVALGYTAETAMEEASRCVRCYGKAVVEKDKCIDCNQCVEFCEHGAVTMVPREEPRFIPKVVVKEEDREKVMEICKKMHLYPTDLTCPCNFVLAEEVAQCIVDGARSLEDIVQRTGARSGCGGIYCTSKLIGLLKAGGIDFKTRPDQNYVDYSMSMWDLPDEVVKKYSNKHFIQEERNLFYKEELADKAWSID